MKTTNFITAIALAGALLFSSCNKTESGNTDKVEVLNYTYDSETKTYTVYTAAGLLAWNVAVQDTLSLNCTLGSDIDLTDSTWTTVGNYENPYTGTFEGSGHTITGLTIDRGEASQYVGLIGGLGVGGVVQNLTLANVNITGSGTYVGGVVGWNYAGAVTDCSVSGSVTGSSLVGGVVGSNYSGTVTACTVSGTVSGSRYVGGAVGQNNSTVTACSASCSVDGSSTVGGVVGENNYAGTVTACYHASGSVYGTSSVGGVVGWHGDGTVTVCYWSDYDGTGIGGSNSGDDTTKVDGTEVSWADAVGYMNEAIDTWNGSNPGKYCYWQYELDGTGYPTLMKNE